MLSHRQSRRCWGKTKLARRDKGTINGCKRSYEHAPPSRKYIDGGESEGERRLGRGGERESGGREEKREEREERTGE